MDIQCNKIKNIIESYIPKLYSEKPYIISYIEIEVKDNFILDDGIKLEDVESDSIEFILPSFILQDFEKKESFVDNYKILHFSCYKYIRHNPNDFYTNLYAVIDKNSLELSNPYGCALVGIYPSSFYKTPFIIDMYLNGEHIPEPLTDIEYSDYLLNIIQTDINKYKNIIYTVNKIYPVLYQKTLKTDSIYLFD